MTQPVPSHPTWALATVAGPRGPLGCVEAEGRLYPLSVAVPGLGDGTVAGLFADWAGAEAALDAAVPGLDPSDALPEGLARLAPILWPGKVLCAGANYYNHLAEMGFPNVTKNSQRLFFFFKPPRNAVVGEGATVHMPLDTAAFDWEVELAVVIGRTARAVSPETALDHVAAYTVAVDFCARDLNRAPETFYKLDWVAGKAQESCCPLGPRLIPARAIPDPQALRLRLAVNGVGKQDDTTGDMIFSVAEQISILSRIMTLDPGDVLLTGTPAGVGAPKGTFLSVGDRVEAAIDGIGTLTTTIQTPKL
jgi:2-keto-4-pentenoate hydratase/2-oxohepta-3-ene-1,7-dioic acid hydratase in catechol pathway